MATELAAQNSTTAGPAVKTERQLFLEMFYAAERLNAAIQDAQSVLGKPVYLEIASREGFVRVTPILYPVAL